MNSRVLTVALFLLVSGMCALVFQMAWLREFRLIFGASTPASAAVLAIFMGGLGLGNAVLGRRVDASPNPLRLYSLFELGISVASVASPFLIVLPIAWTVSLLVLAAVFYGLLTPLGLMFRLMGRDVLDRRPDPEQDTYWQGKPAAESPRRYLRQY